MLSQKEVKNIASLARIGVSEADVEKYQKDLSAVLDYFKTLEELDTTGIEPIGHATAQENVLRGDMVEVFGDEGREAILKNAPETKNKYIKVKSVL